MLAVAASGGLGAVVIAAAACGWLGLVATAFFLALVASDLTHRTTRAAGS